MPNTRSAGLGTHGELLFYQFKETITDIHRLNSSVYVPGYVLVEEIQKGLHL